MGNRVPRPPPPPPPPPTWADTMSEYTNVVKLTAGNLVDWMSEAAGSVWSSGMPADATSSQKATPVKGKNATKLPGPRSSAKKPALETPSGRRGKKKDKNTKAKRTRESKVSSEALAEPADFPDRVRVMAGDALAQAQQIFGSAGTRISGLGQDALETSRHWSARIAETLGRDVHEHLAAGLMLSLLLIVVLILWPLRRLLRPTGPKHPTATPAGSTPQGDPTAVTADAEADPPVTSPEDRDGLDAHEGGVPLPDGPADAEESAATDTAPVEVSEESTCPLDKESTEQSSGEVPEGTAAEPSESSQAVKTVDIDSDTVLVEARDSAAADSAPAVAQTLVDEKPSPAEEEHEETPQTAVADEEDEEEAEDKGEEGDKEEEEKVEEEDDEEEGDKGEEEEEEKEEEMVGDMGGEEDEEGMKKSTAATWSQVEQSDAVAHLEADARPETTAPETVKAEKSSESVVDLLGDVVAAASTAVAVLVEEVSGYSDKPAAEVKKHVPAEAVADDASPDARDTAAVVKEPPSENEADQAAETVGEIEEVPTMKEEETVGEIEEVPTMKEEETVDEVEEVPTMKDENFVGFPHFPSPFLKEDKGRDEDSFMSAAMAAAGALEASPLVLPPPSPAPSPAPTSAPATHFGEPTVPHEAESPEVPIEESGEGQAPPASSSSPAEASEAPEAQAAESIEGTPEALPSRSETGGETPAPIEGEAGPSEVVTEAVDATSGADESNELSAVPEVVLDPKEGSGSAEECGGEEEAGAGGAGTSSADDGAPASTEESIPGAGADQGLVISVPEEAVQAGKDEVVAEVKEPPPTLSSRGSNVVAGFFGVGIAAAVGDAVTAIAGSVKERIDAIELGLFQDAAPKVSSSTSGAEEDQTSAADKEAPPTDSVGEGVTDSAVEGKETGSTTPSPSQGPGIGGGAASVTEDQTPVQQGSLQEAQAEASAVEQPPAASGGSSGDTGHVAVEEVSVIELSDERQDLRAVFPGSAGGPLRQLSLGSLASDASDDLAGGGLSERDLSLEVGSTGRGSDVEPSPGGSQRVSRSSSLFSRRRRTSSGDDPSTSAAVGSSDESATGTKRRHRFMKGLKSLGGIKRDSSKGGGRKSDK